MNHHVNAIADNRTRDFAIACYNHNTIEELEAPGPDVIDMEQWGISALQWQQAVEAALADLKADQADEEE